MTGSLDGVPASRVGQRSAAITTLGGALLVVVLAVLGHTALLSPDGFLTRDHVDFYLRVGQYAREVADGHWPQSLPDALRGGGHAFPLYYPPLAHWVALGAYATGLPLIPASHAAALLSVACSGLFLFLLLRQLTGSVGAALFGATCYLIFPYRYQLLQGRGTFAEGWVLACLPAVLLAARIREPARVLWLPLSIALLLLSHTALAVWALPIVALLIWGTEATSGQARESLKALARGTILALGLGMFYFLPMRLGLAKVNAADPVVMLTTPANVAAGELLFSRLPFPSVAAGLVAAVGVTLAVGLFRRPRRQDLAGRWSTAALIPLLLCASALAAPLLAWQLTPGSLRYIQSPVRLLGPAGFLLALVAGLWASKAFRGHPLRLAILTGALLSMAVTWGRAGRVTRISASELASLQATSYPDLGFTLRGDYLPRGADPFVLANHIETTRNGAGAPPLTRWLKTAQGYEARVDAPRGTVVRLPLVGYDFHDVRRGGDGAVEVAVIEGQLAVLGSGQPVDLVIGRRLSPGIVPGLAISLATLGFLLGTVHRARSGAKATPRRR